MSEAQNIPATEEQDEVGFGDVQTSTFPKYQGQTGVVDRVAVLSAKLQRSYSYFLDDAKKRVRVAHTPPDWLQKRLGMPEQKFALILFKYATDDDGNLLDESTLRGKVVIWVFSEKKFDEIKARFQRHKLMNDSDEQVDLQISCSDSEWQKMSFDVEDKAHWRSKPEWIEALTKKIEDARRRADLYLGERKSEAEFKALLGIASSAPGGSSDDDVDLGDVLSD